MSSTAVITIDAPELKVIEPTKAESIKAIFEPMAQMLSEFDERFTSVTEAAKTEITKKVTAEAKRLRLDIAKVRTETEKRRKSEKEEYLRAGKAIDGVSNILKWAVTDKENALKAIEDHFENLERERLESLQREREELLSQYVDDAETRKLAEMESDVWEAYFAAKKKDHEDRLAAEKKAEEERVAREKAEAEERERIRVENERLKKEAEERDRLAKIEKEKREKAERERIAKEEAERKAREEQARKEREEHEAQLAAERAERERIEREEREKRESLEAELKAREEAERKAAEEAESRKEAAIQAELSKGDSERAADLLADLSSLKGKYEFKSQKHRAAFRRVQGHLDNAIAEISR